MECNRKCYWNYNGQCCPESEEDYNNATANEDCPTWLDKDFEKNVWNTYYNIIKLIKHRNYEELKAIEEFIINQRKNENINIDKILKNFEENKEEFKKKINDVRKRERKSIEHSKNFICEK